MISDSKRKELLQKALKNLKEANRLLQEIEIRLEHEYGQRKIRDQY